MRINNFIVARHKTIVTDTADVLSYATLYTGFANKQLRDIFSVLHVKIVEEFSMMNQRLPTKAESAYFWAENSRTLLYALEHIKEIHKTLKGSEFEFSIDEKYGKLFDFCESFLEKYRGSVIPPNTERIEIYETIPIFTPNDVVEIQRKADKFPFMLQVIGEGSYAKVFKYTDDFYNRQFVLKRAKSDLTPKELERFKREFDEMKEFSSPYIVEVFSFDETKNEYIMEFMDATLLEHIRTENSQLTLAQRKPLIQQILRAFKYIHFKGRLHRDISPNNILIKKYDDTIVVKISDFGLVKTPNSDLTSTNTEFKGCFNDPALRTEGFNNYGLLHETYALTLVTFFVLTGKTNIANIKDVQIKAFVEKGTNADKTKRFQSIDEMISAIGSL